MNYVKSNVVMLTTKKAKVGQIILTNSKDEIIYGLDFGSRNLHGNRLFDIGKYDDYYEPKQLYFTTDDKIVEGDWCVYKEKYIVQIIETDPSGFICSDSCKPLLHEVKKIIATTDESLDLPRPSTAFLKIYCINFNNNKQITEVNIEQTESPVWDGDDNTSEVVGYTKTIRVSPDNTITIKKVEPKTYSEEEVLILLKRAFGVSKSTGCYLTGEEVNAWISQNIK